MSKRDRICYLCGEKYKYCPTCGNDKNKPAWMSEFHSEDCKNIFETCTRFNMELITKEEAATELKKCDLTNKDQFEQSAKETIDKIFATSQPKQIKPQAAPAKPQTVTAKPQAEK